MKAQVVSFHCVLKSYTGKLISSAYYQEVLTFADGHSGILAVLIRGLQNLKKGEKRKIVVKADQAYGFYEPELMIKILRRDLPFSEQIDIGHEVITQDKQGEYRTFRVIEVFDKTLVLDGNHPLAGQDLIFEVEATSIRCATSRELEQTHTQYSKIYLH